MIWMYCPKCGAPMRSVTTGWICTELGCGCKLDVYGNQYTDTTYNVDYWYEVKELNVKYLSYKETRELAEKNF